MPSPRAGAMAMAIVLMSVAAAPAAGAENAPAVAPRVVLAPESRLTLCGKSTLHDYTSRATRFELAVELADALPAGPSPLARLAGPGAVKSIVLTIPVAGMTSDKDGLDKNMHKALKAMANPNIVFRLQTAAAGAAGAPFQVAGELEVAGRTRPIEIEVRAHETPQGIVLEGNKELLMSDYGIKPPTMFLGTLKTDDRVVVEWRLFLTHTGF